MSMISLFLFLMFSLFVESIVSVCFIRLCKSYDDGLGMNRQLVGGFVQNLFVELFFILIGIILFVINYFGIMDIGMFVSSNQSKSSPILDIYICLAIFSMLYVTLVNSSYGRIIKCNRTSEFCLNNC